MTVEWSIQELARSAGTTSRTLRHYDAIGLLKPSRVGPAGHRHYDGAGLLRLQRILLLRELGIGLSAVAEILEGQRDTSHALRTHLELLERERARLARQITAVRTTLDKWEGGEPLMASEALDGFAHTRYRDEAIARWGREAYEQGDRWWRSMSEEDRQGFQQRHEEIARDFARAHRTGWEPGGDEVREIVRRHFSWVVAGRQGRRLSAEEYAGLGQMYTADPRFAAVYDAHGAGLAEFVRRAMEAYAADEL